jgi:hypothetical protein
MDKMEPILSELLLKLKGMKFMELEEGLLLFNTQRIDHLIKDWHEKNDNI